MRRPAKTRIALETVHTVNRMGHQFLRMTDDKTSDELNTDDDLSQDPERETEDVRDRTGEERAMNGDPSGRLGDLGGDLEGHDYPATTDELVAAYGDYEIEIQDGTKSLREVLSTTDNQTYDSASDIQARILGLVHR